MHVFSLYIIQEIFSVSLSGYNILDYTHAGRLFKLFRFCLLFLRSLRTFGKFDHPTLPEFTQLFK